MMNLSVLPRYWLNWKQSKNIFFSSNFGDTYALNFVSRVPESHVSYLASQLEMSRLSALN